MVGVRQGVLHTGHTIVHDTCNVPTVASSDLLAADVTLPDKSTEGQWGSGTHPRLPNCLVLGSGARQWMLHALLKCGVDGRHLPPLLSWNQKPGHSVSSVIQETLLSNTPRLLKLRCGVSGFVSPLNTRVLLIPLSTK